jgi:hypothetical protein
VCTRAGESVVDDAGFKRACAEKRREELGQKEAERRERARRAKDEKRRMDLAFSVRALPTLYDPSICLTSESSVVTVVRGGASTGTEPHRRP